MLQAADTISQMANNRPIDVAEHATPISHIDSAGDRDSLRATSDHVGDIAEPSQIPQVLQTTTQHRLSLIESIYQQSENPFSVVRSADFIRAAMLDTKSSHDNTADVSAASVFGASSTLEQPAAQAKHYGTGLTNSGIFQGMVVVVAAVYILLLARYLTEAYTLIRRTLRESAKNSRMFDSQRGSYIKFLNLIILVGIPLLGIAVVKFADIYAGSSLEASLCAEFIPAAAILSTGLFALLAITQTALLKIVGYITLTKDFIADLLYLRRTYFSLMILAVAPSVLLYALCWGNTGRFWYYAIIVTTIITIGLYLKETLVLFISKKISILRWFLYLCAVEIFPFSLIWLLAVKY